MNPLDPLDTNFVFKASASSSGLLLPDFYEADAGLVNKPEENSLYERAPLLSVS